MLGKTTSFPSKNDTKKQITIGYSISTNQESSDYCMQNYLVALNSIAYRLIFTNRSFKAANYCLASERDLFAADAILVTFSVITRKLHLY